MSLWTDKHTGTAFCSCGLRSFYSFHIPRRPANKSHIYLQSVHSNFCLITFKKISYFNPNPRKCRLSNIILNFCLFISFFIRLEGLLEPGFGPGLDIIATAYPLLLLHRFTHNGFDRNQINTQPIKVFCVCYVKRF